MTYPLLNNQKIYQLIREKIKDPYLTNYIISLKIKMENVEILDYHMYQYNNIIKPYIQYTFQDDRRYSLIFSNQEYHIENDIEIDFFNKTNISHQVIELIQQLICIKDKEEQKYEDILLSILANEIMKYIKYKYNYE